MNKIIIVGASSGIGKELARLYADTDAELALLQDLATRFFSTSKYLFI